MIEFSNWIVDVGPSTRASSALCDDKDAEWMPIGIDINA